MIIFIHIPGFYAAIEQADSHELRGRPVVVGGDPSKRGSVTSASAEARSLGVEEGMDAREALALCPDAVFRRTRLKRYRTVAAEVRALVRDTTDRLEELGVDGTFLEGPSQVEPLPLAAELCVRIQAELGLSAVAGVGPSRFVAHLGARHPGPGGIRQVRSDEVLSFLGRFPLTEIWGLGPSTAKKLAASGFESIADLQTADPDKLEELAGRNAATFRALGRDIPAPASTREVHVTGAHAPRSDARSATAGRRAVGAVRSAGVDTGSRTAVCPNGDVGGLLHRWNPGDAHADTRGFGRRPERDR